MAKCFISPKCNVESADNIYLHTFQNFWIYFGTLTNLHVSTLRLGNALNMKRYTCITPNQDIDSTAYHWITRWWIAYFYSGLDSYDYHNRMWPYLFICQYIQYTVHYSSSYNISRKLSNLVHQVCSFHLVNVIYILLITLKNSFVY